MKAPNEITRQWCIDENLDPETQYDVFLWRHLNIAALRPYDYPVSPRHWLYALAFGIEKSTYEGWQRVIRRICYNHKLRWLHPYYYGAVELTIGGRDLFSIKIFGYTIIIHRHENKIVFTINTKERLFVFYLTNENEWVTNV